MSQDLKMLDNDNDNDELPSPNLTSNDNHRPWVEKYRPKQLNEVSHHKEIVATLQNAVETNRLPHILMYGPPGTGKTSVALALCRTLYSPELIGNRVLELNASDERGISVVREKIKQFASLAVGENSTMGYFAKERALNSRSSSSKKSSFPNPPYKIVILDEADTVTTDAQSALRRIIEATSRVTRFILICNYVTRIIEPLASRCAKFRFQPLPVASMQARLEFIAKQEKCTLSPAVLSKILEICGGDMRRAVTTLQSAHMLTGEDEEDLSVDLIQEMAGFPPVSCLDKLWQAIESLELGTLEVVIREEILTTGFSVPSLYALLIEKLVSSTSLSDLAKANVSIGMAESDKCLLDGADDYLQLLHVCSLLQQEMAREKADNDDMAQ